jgi:WD40 repeat protein
MINLRSYHLILLGHHHTIYDLTWSSDDKLLLSASSDGTAKVWDIKQNVSKTLQHASFVYCAAFHPVDRMIVTGAYDSIIRFWDQDAGSVLFQITGHESHVNTMCFDRVCNKLTLRLM